MFQSFPSHTVYASNAFSINTILDGACCYVVDLSAVSECLCQTTRASSCNIMLSIIVSPQHIATFTFCHSPLCVQIVQSVRHVRQFAQLQYITIAWRYYCNRRRCVAILAIVARTVQQSPSSYTELLRHDDRPVFE